MKKRIADAIMDAVQTRKVNVPLTAIWREIHQEFSIGIRRDRELHLSLNDHNLLRDVMRKAAGFDPLTESPSFATRMEAAATVVDEKWGGAAGAKRLVNVYRRDAPISTIRGTCKLPPGCGLWVDANDLELSSVPAVVVVENLQAFLNIEAFCLPPEWWDALFVYRGHSGITTGVTALLARLTKETPVAVMSDYDAAGLRIALSTKAASGWLGPALDASLGPSNSELFEKQAHYLHGLQAEGPEGLQFVISRLVRERIALTQERMAAKKVRIAFHAFGG